LEEQIERQGSLLTDTKEKEALSDSQLKEERMKGRDLESLLSQVRLERDQAIGEKYLVQAQLKEISHYAAAEETCRGLEDKLAETKLQVAYLKTDVENLRDELNTAQALLLFKGKGFEVLHKELVKSIEQRDVIWGRYSSDSTSSSSRNSDLDQTSRQALRVRPKVALKPPFIQGVFKLGVASSRPSSCDSSVAGAHRVHFPFRGLDLKLE
jgi:hypothetical protein